MLWKSLLNTFFYLRSFFFHSRLYIYIFTRMLAKSTIQPNIRRIYDDLLGFDGCEFYFASHPELAGRSFNDASLMLKGAVLVGVKREGEILLNPESRLPAHSNLGHRKSNGKHLLNSNGEFMLLTHDEIIVSFGLIDWCWLSSQTRTKTVSSFVFVREWTRICFDLNKWIGHTHAHTVHTYIVSETHILFPLNLIYNHA